LSAYSRCRAVREHLLSAQSRYSSA